MDSDLSQWETPSQENLDTDLSQWEGNPAAVQSTQQAIDQALAPDKAKLNNMVSGLPAGIMHGIANVGSSISRPLFWASDHLAGTNFMPGWEAQNNAENQQFDQKYAGNAYADAGKFAGQIATSAPLMEAGGLGLGALKNIPGMSGVSDFLTGNAGAAQAESAAASGGSETLANRLTRYLSKGTSGAIAGGSAAATSTAGSNEDPGNQIVRGMEFGGGIGGAAPLAVDTAGGTVSGIANGIRSVGSPESYAASKVTQALMRDGINSPEQMQAALQKIGPNASIADLGSNSARLARAAVSQPSLGSSQIQDFLSDRIADQPQRILDSVHEGLGVDQGKSFEEAMDALSQKRSEDSAPLYQKAFSNDSPAWSPRIQQFLDTPEVQQGLQRGIKIQRLNALAENQPFNPSDYAVKDFNEAGDPIISQTPNMRLLDAGKKGLDAMIQDNTDAVTGKVNEMGRALTKTKSAYLDELDNLNPDYAAARQAYAGPSQSMDVAQKGRQFIKSPSSVSDKYVSGLSEDDKPFFRLGAADAIQQGVNGMGDSGQLGPDVANKVLGSPTKRAALAKVFPDDDSFQKFTDTVNNESQMRNTGKNIIGNSNTVSKAQELADAGAGVSPGDMFHAATDPTGFSIKKVGNALSNMTKFSPEKANALAPFYTDLGFAQNNLQSRLGVTPAYVKWAKKLGSAVGNNAQVTGTLPTYLRNFNDSSNP